MILVAVVAVIVFKSKFYKSVVRGLSGHPKLAKVANDDKNYFHLKVNLKTKKRRKKEEKDIYKAIEDN